MKALIKYRMLMILIGTVFLAHLLFWSSLNKANFNYDSLRHYLNSLYVFDGLKSGTLSEVHKQISRYPAGGYLVNALFYFFIPPTQKNAAVINTAVFLCILFFSLYKLGQEVQDRKLGVLSCVLVILYPAVFHQTKLYMLDFPLLAMVTLNIYLLVKTDEMKNGKFVFLYLLSFLAGIAIKINFLFFAAGPVVYIFLSVLKKKNLFRSVFVLMGMAAVGVLIVLFGIPDYYTQTMFRGKFFLQTLRGSGVICTWAPDTLLQVPLLIHKIRAALWYTWGFINWQGGVLFFFIFLFGLYSFAGSRNRHKGIILVWLFSSYAALSWFLYAIDFDMEVTGIRYSLPLLGGVSLISSYCLLNIRRRSARRAAISIAVAWGVVQNLIVSYPLIDRKYELTIPVKQDLYHILPAYLTVFSTRPLIISGSNWLTVPQDKTGLAGAIEEAFFFINGLAGNDRVTVLLLSDNSEWWYLAYLAYRYNRNIRFFCDYSRMQDFPGSTLMPGYPCMFIHQSDCVIELKEPFTEPYLQHFNSDLRACFEDALDDFSLIRENEVCKIFKRNP